MPDMPVDLMPYPLYPDHMEARVAVLEHIAKTTVSAFERLEQRLERLEQRQDQMIDRMDRRFDAMDRKFETMDQRWVKLNDSHRQDFVWLIAIQVAMIGGLLTAMARGFHWL